MVKKIFLFTCIMQLASGAYHKIGNSYEEAIHSNDIAVIKGAITRLAAHYDQVKILQDGQAKLIRKKIILLVNRALTLGAAEEIHTISAGSDIISIFKQLLKERAQRIKEQEQRIEEQESFIIIEKELESSEPHPSHATCTLQ